MMQMKNQFNKETSEVFIERFDLFLISSKNVKLGNKSDIEKLKLKILQNNILIIHNFSISINQISDF